MPEIQVPDLSSLDSYLQVTRTKYDACFASLDDRSILDAPKAELEYHYLRLDPTGKPKVKELAESLVEHLAAYAYRAESLPQTLNPVEWGSLLRRARSLLRSWITTGEPGEIVLYMLIEALLRAPQIIAKLELKMNPELEQHGSDGIHARWNEQTQRLELILGESKLHTTASLAAKNAAKSILQYHDKRLLAHEIGLLSAHFKWADEQLKDKLISTIDPINASGDFNLIHACLLGYNWPGYDTATGTTTQERMQSIAEAYKSEVDRLRDQFEARFRSLRGTTLKFIVFHLPMPSVQDFRDSFLAALG